MGVRNFIDTKIKKLGKEERIDFLREEMPGVAEFYIRKGHHEQDKVQKIFDKLSDEKFVGVLNKWIKEAKDNDEEIDIGIVTLITDFLEKRSNNLDEDTVSKYVSAIDKILKKKVKKLSGKLDLDKDFIKELLVVLPDESYASEGKYIGFTVQRMLRRIYLISKDNDICLKDTKQLKKLFKALFGSEMLGWVAINILLERKENMKQFNNKQLDVWNLLSNFALDTLNDMEKDDLKEFISFYADRRAKDAEKNRDSARRIQLSQVSQDDYGRIAKAVCRLSEKDKVKKYL
jgi:hypothetical protein